MRRRLSLIANVVLARFTEWFESSGGVWQTAGITAAIVVCEASGVFRDPNGFWLLYWLTVYSAVTQPALAHSGRVNSDKLDSALERITQLEDQILSTETRILTALGIDPREQS